MSIVKYLALRVNGSLRRAAITVFAGLLLLLSAVPTTAQWTTNGNNVSNTNSGNVGVGTATPASRLTIVGPVQNGVYTVQIDSTAGGQAGAQHGLLLLGTAATTYLTAGATTINGTAPHLNITAGDNANYTATFGNTGGTGRVLRLRTTSASSIPVMQVEGSNGATVSFAALANGNVGVGTGTPTSKLHLRSGTDSATTLFHLDTGTHGGTAFAVSGTANNESGYDLSVFRAGQYYSRFGVSTARNVYLQPGGGTVGIGTGTPNTSYRLDVQGGSINASGGLCIAGDCKSAWSQITGSSQWSTSGSTINYAGGNVGIGAAAPTEKLEVTGNVKVTGNIHVTGNINAKYQDVAEWVESSQELAAGTVVVLDATRSNQVIAATQAYDSRVAGVISLQPGLALGEAGAGRVLVATTGRVKVKVDATNGPIQIGDLLVTSERAGVAMKSVPVEIGGVSIHRPGTLLGKALEPLAQGTGEILVLLSMQ